MKKIKLLTIFLYTFFSFLLVGCTTTNNLCTQQFIQKMVNQHQFDRSQLTALFSHQKPNPKVLKAMTRPSESTPWYAYREIFLTRDRVRDGAQFWQQHATTLTYAKNHYGVSPQIIVAILGVETHYGRSQGGFNALNTLSTLAFYYPPREKYFQDELEQYLLLSREVPFDAGNMTSSYAGALAAPQFMPSSYRHYAMAYNSNGSKGDLFHNTDDAIISIANYLKSDGWQPDDKIAVPAHVVGNDYGNLHGSKPKWTIAELAKYHVYPNQLVNAREHAFLVTLQDRDHPEYWIGLPDMYVIMRYNPSTLYAMAVYQLGESIKKEYMRMQKIS